MTRQCGGVQPDDLALAVHRGEGGAVEALVRMYQDQLFGYALRLLHDRADAQEVTQDAFLRAYHALTRRYTEEQCRSLLLRPWLLRITRNVAYNRRRARRGVQEQSLPEGDGWQVPIAPSEEAGLVQEEAGVRLGLALERLGPGEREVVQLRFVAELPYAEIATIVGAGESAVRGRVFRALRRLRTFMSELEGCHAL